MTTPRTYAAETTVPISKTRLEIESMLLRNGATEFGYAQTEREQGILFTLSGRRIKMTLRTPTLVDHDVQFDASGRYRAPRLQATQRDQLARSRWRALKLVLQAKLAAIAAGIRTVEEEFLADVVTDSGQTVREWMEPWLQKPGPPQLPRG